MEILTPETQPEQVIPQRTDIPKDLLDAGITLKNLEFLNHLGLKDEMFNSKVMEKMEFISQNIPDLMALQDIDMRLGNDGSTPRIDKIYTFLKLEQQAGRLRDQQNFIQEQIEAL